MMKKKGKEITNDINEQIKTILINKEKILKERQNMIPELEISKIETRLRNSIQELITPILVRLELIDKNSNEGALSVDVIGKKYTSIMFTIQKFKQTKMVFDDLNKRLENLAERTRFFNDTLNKFKDAESNLNENIHDKLNKISEKINKQNNELTSKVSEIFAKFKSQENFLKSIQIESNIMKSEMSRNTEIVLKSKAQVENIETRLTENLSIHKSEALNNTNFLQSKIISCYKLIEEKNAEIIMEQQKNIDSKVESLFSRYIDEYDEMIRKKLFEIDSKLKIEAYKVVKLEDFVKQINDLKKNILNSQKSFDSLKQSFELEKAQNKEIVEPVESKLLENKAHEILPIDTQITQVESKASDLIRKKIFNTGKSLSTSFHENMDKDLDLIKQSKVKDKEKEILREIDQLEIKDYSNQKNLGVSIEDIHNIINNMNLASKSDIENYIKMEVKEKIKDCNTEYSKNIDNRLKEIDDKISNQKDLYENFIKNTDEIILSIKELKLNLSEEIDLRKQLKSDTNITLGSFQKSINSLRISNENNSTNINKIKSLVSALINDVKLQHIMETQDEIDKESISLIGIKEGNYEQTKPSKPLVSINQQCFSCTSEPSCIISAFKIACLMYNPNPIIINNNSFSRKNLIKLRSFNLDNAISKNSLENLENSLEMWNIESIKMSLLDKEKIKKNIVSNLLNLTSKKKSKFSQINKSFTHSKNSIAGIFRSKPRERNFDVRHFSKTPSLLFQ